MCRLAIISLALLGIVSSPLRADNSLPVKTLKEIKEATVFIRIEKDRVASASGSGFLIRADGETGYIVTNHHVVHLTKKIEVRSSPFGMPQPIRPGRPFPGLPVPPGFETRTEILEVAVPAPNITLVFGSGTTKERSVTAEVVAADADADLAVLKITGVKDLPKPIDLRPPELVETMQVYVFGFPFGKDLAIGVDNPAISVNRASVSSIRTSKSGDIKVVQIDGDVNPGNSGGPVVDSNGQLVGVVVAKIRNTQIGMAIPTQELHLMLAGRVAPPKLSAGKADKSTLEISVEVGLVDPLEQIKSVAFHYAPTGTVTEDARKGGLAKLPECKTATLKRNGQKAVGTISVPVAERGGVQLTCQAAFVKADGKTVLSDLTVSALNEPAPPVEVRRPDPPVTPIPTPPPPPPLQPEVKFDAAALAAVLRPNQPGDRGPLVGVTLPPLAKGKVLTADELDAIVAELRTPDKAQGAVKRLQNTEADAKRQAEVARLLEKGAVNPDWSVFARAEAVAVLRRWGTPESFETLSALLSDPSVHSIHFRHPALWTMAYLGGDKAIAAIAGRIEDFVDRRVVVQMLQQMGSATEPQALALLDNPRAEIRVEAAKVLKIVGTKASAPALFKAEQDQNETLRNEARAALLAIAARQEMK